MQLEFFLAVVKEVVFICLFLDSIKS